MKKTLLIALIAASGLFARAQQTPPVQPSRPYTQAAQGTQVQDPSKFQAPYLTYPTIPPFHLLKLDSASYLTKEDLKKHRQTMIMFFSPDCDHCKRQTDSLLAVFDQFQDIEIVMATYQPFGEMKEFYAHYHLADHPNIKMGRDEKFFLVPFYRIRNLPYLALYDKKGNLITTFEGTQKVDTILQAFKQKMVKN